MASRDETETVITWTAADAQATVYTLMPHIARLCRQAGGTEIRKAEGVCAGQKEAWTFLIDPASIRIRPRRQPSTAQQAALALARATRKRAKSARLEATIG